MRAQKPHCGLGANTIQQYLKQSAERKVSARKPFYGPAVH